MVGGTPASSTTKTGRHDIAEILLKVALSTKKTSSLINLIRCTQPAELWYLSTDKLCSDLYSASLPTG
jgi:hypothetical protein